MNTCSEGQGSQTKSKSGEQLESFRDSRGIFKYIWFMLSGFTPMWNTAKGVWCVLIQFLLSELLRITTKE